jgi:hypothetical protein
LNIPIHEYSDILQSLNAISTFEPLIDQNQYACDHCHKHVDALRSVSYRKLPNVLIFCLSRFEYDLKKGARVKNKNEFQFPFVLDMQPFSEETISKIPIPDTIDDWIKSNSNNGSDAAADDVDLDSEYCYELCNVVIHSGDAGGGHYHCYIKDLLGEGVRATTEGENAIDDSKWFDFNDSNVSSISIDKIISQYGGNEFGKFKNECAYMAIYRKSNLAAPRAMDIPVHLQEGIVQYNKELEKKRVEWQEKEAQRLKEREEMMLKFPKTSTAGYNTFGIMKRSALHGSKKNGDSEQASDEEVNVDGVDDLFEGFGNLEITPSIPVAVKQDNFFFAPKMQFETEPLPDLGPDDEEDEVEEMENVVNKKKTEIGQIAKKVNRPMGIAKKNRIKNKKGPKFTERSKKSRIREYDPETKTMITKERDGSFSVSETQAKKRVVFERSLKIQVGDDEYEWVSCSSSDSDEAEAKEEV